MIAPTAGPGGITGMRDSLERWGEANRRDLPWRRTRDPWLILVSEVMLAQTQVKRVVPRWEEFGASFPTPAACAAAPLADVLVLWSGLGYPRRAVNLHRCATEVVTRHGGRVPEDLVALRALPGIGPYTARAVLTFAFEHDVGVVDTNVGRLLARLGGERLTPARAQAAADELVAPGGGWAWNQAMFDLGASVCTKRSPACHRCPLADWCSWRRSGGFDPAEGSAGTSGRQAPFAGSDRQARGQVMAALVQGERRLGELVALVDAAHPARVARLVAALMADGLVEEVDGVVRLPRRAGLTDHAEP